MYVKLREELKRQKLSIVDLSNKTGIKYLTLWHKVRGDYPITFDEAKKIKAALAVDTPLEDLFEVTA